MRRTLAREPEGRRRGHRPQISGAADQGAADRGAARHLRLHEPVHAAVPAFPPRRHRCAQARAHLPVRHPAHQRHPRAQGQGSGRGAGRGRRERRGLVGRHAHRHLAACLQQAVGAPRAHPGRDRAAHHRRARARSRRPAGLRDRPAAPLLPAADLAQSAAAVLRLRGQGQGHPHHGARTSTNCGRSTISNSMAELVRALSAPAAGPAIPRPGWRRLGREKVA